MRLTKKHKKALSDLIWFGGTEDDHIWYIDEIPRPSELWYIIAEKIAPHMLIEPFRTTDGGWWATRNADGSARGNARTGPWQGAYHNGRALILCAKMLEELAK